MKKSQSHPFGLPVAPPLNKGGIDPAHALTYSVDKTRQWLKGATEAEIITQGQHRALQLFRAAVKRIPAYRDILKKHRVQPDRIRTIRDFDQLPLLDKDNYILHYPIEKRVWDGTLKGYGTVAISSGTTSTALLWPRDPIMEHESDMLHELLLTELADLKHKRTLAVVGFAMGAYTAGVLTYRSLQAVSQKGYPLWVVSPGLDMNDTLSLVTTLLLQVDQIVFFGYPSWIKDFADELRSRRIRARRVDFVFIPAGESFTEAWRAYVLDTLQSVARSVRVMSLYGCSEKTILGHETEFSQGVCGAIAARIDQAAAAPNVYQYHPYLRHFETVNSHLVLTATGGVPLIRYDIKDRGEVIPFSAASALLGKTNRLVRNAWKLPCVAVAGREQAIMLYAANIYPSTIKRGIEVDAFQKRITGRFAIKKQYTKKQQESLHVLVELQKGTKQSSRLQARIQQSVMNALLKVNREYGVILRAKGKQAIPRIQLLPYGQPIFLGRTGKASLVVS